MSRPFHPRVRSKELQLNKMLLSCTDYVVEQGLVAEDGWGGGGGGKVGEKFGVYGVPQSRCEKQETVETSAASLHLHADVPFSPLMNVCTTNFDIDETKKIKVGFAKPKYRMASTNLRSMKNRLREAYCILTV